MKYLLVLIVVLVGVWLLLRGRAAPKAGKGTSGRRGSPDAPAAMVACAHCGLHLPHNEAVTDGSGRPYCSDAHRLAGPP